MFKFVENYCKIVLTFILFLLIICDIYVCNDSDVQYFISNGHYMNLWVVHIPSGPETSDHLSNQMGFLNLGPVSNVF